tara:strand:+ start:109 stop:384 length:276 start_codon:yes stop_codon:yes gene_type:complete
MVVAVVVMKVVQELMEVLVVEQPVVEVLDQETLLQHHLLKEMMEVLHNLQVLLFMELVVEVEQVLQAELVMQILMLELVELELQVILQVLV